MVDSVETGAIVFNIMLNLIAPIALNVIANVIYDRLKSIGQRKTVTKNNTMYKS